MKFRYLLALPLALALMSCGGGSDEPEPAKQSTPLAQAPKALPAASEQTIFSWAEAKFPTLFPLTMEGTLAAGDALYRRYPATDVALVVYHGGVYAVGGLTGNRFIELGAQSSFPPLSPVWYAPVHYSSYSTRSGSLVIRDSSEWSAAWIELWRDFQDGRAPYAMPAIDFSQEMLVGFYGRNSRGCGSKVQRVELAGDGGRVFYTEGPSSCASFPAIPGVPIPQPANIVKIPKVAGAVDFVVVPEVDWSPVVGASNAWNYDLPARTFVVQSEQAWRDVWAQHFVNVSQAPQLPVIDFSSRMVAAIYLGSRGNGCYGLEISRVTESERAVTVVYREHIPTAGMNCTQSVVHPAALLTIPKTSKPVEFVSM